MERGEWSVHSFTPVLIARIVAGSAYFWASFMIRSYDSEAVPWLGSGRFLRLWARDFTWFRLRFPGL